MARERVEWVDAARGFALCLVVLYHVTGDAQLYGLVPNARLSQLDLVLDGFRMPTLVMISGLLAASVRSWPWMELLRRRIGPLALVYVVWSMVVVPLAGVLIYGRGLREAFLYVWLPLIRPGSGTWYLFALIVYLALAKALRGVPSAVLLPLAALLNILVVANWPSDWGYWGLLYWAQVGQHWIFFVAAERGSRLYWKVAQAASARRATVAIVVFASVGVTFVATGIVRNAGSVLLLAALGTAVSLLAAPAWGTRAGMGWARAVGRSSLGVYLAHTWVAVVVVRAVVPHVPSFPGGGFLVPLSLAIVTIAISYAITRALARWAPVPFLRPWWDTSARPRVGELSGSHAQAQ